MRPMLCMRHSSAGSMNHTFDRLIVNFYQNRAVCCRVSPFTISGPEGLRQDIVPSIIQIHHFFRSDLKEIDENNTQGHTSIFYM